MYTKLNEIHQRPEVFSVYTAEELWTQPHFAPGGKFVFDVFSREAFDAVHEGVSFGRNFMNGFWSAGDCFVFKATYRYDIHVVSLDRYTVVEKDRQWDVYKWLKYFSRDEICDELKQAGFQVVEITDGFGLDPAETTSFGVVSTA